MIAFRKKRGRPSGSRNSVAHAPGLRVPGSSTSAAAMNCRAGVVPVSGAWLYVPGEGFVRWATIHRQVEEAYRAWRIKKSIEGVKIKDGWEWRQAQIAEQLAAKAPASLARKRWLAQWACKHAELERRAAA
jgi:hypothetical protein